MQNCPDHAQWLMIASYGGHYGPGMPIVQLSCVGADLSLAFLRHFYDMNELVKKGITAGVPLTLNTLGIGNGIIDAATQFQYVTCPHHFSPL